MARRCLQNFQEVMIEIVEQPLDVELYNPGVP
jgi:hypothetical protein